MRKRAETSDPHGWEPDPSKEALLTGDPLWELALRVVASRGFSRSQLLTSFLLYICERQILGPQADLTEQRVGEEVFRRGAGYSPGEDNIVRNYARLLRQRLADFFAGEGATEPWQLVVPRGAYVPVLARVEQVAEEVGEEAAAVEGAPEVAGAVTESAAGEPAAEVELPAWSAEDLAAGQRRWRWPVWGVALFALLLCVGAVVAARVRRPSPAETTSTDRFWAEMFGAGRDTIVIPGDDGLVLYEDLTHRRVTLNDYISGEYLSAGGQGVSPEPFVAQQLGIRRYTSFVDLQIVSQLGQLPAARRGRFRVRYAREVNLDDLKRANMILLGSLHANPWTELFQQGLDFQFEQEAGREDLLIHNLHARGGEQAVYRTESDDAHTTYGLLAYRKSIDGGGHVLLLEGINMAGTQAAAELLLNGAAFGALPELRPGDGEWPAFEMLVRTGNFGANAVRSQVIAVHVH